MTKYVFFKPERIQELQQAMGNIETNGKVVTIITRERDGNSSKLKVAVTNNSSDENAVDSFIEALELTMSK